MMNLFLVTLFISLAYSSTRSRIYKVSAEGKLSILVAVARGRRRDYSKLHVDVHSKKNELHVLFSRSLSLRDSIDRDVKVQDKSYEVSIMQELLDQYGLQPTPIETRCAALLETCQCMTEEMNEWPADESQRVIRQRIKKRIKQARHILKATRLNWQEVSSLVLESVFDFLSLKTEREKDEYRQMFSVIPVFQLMKLIDQLWTSMWHLQLLSIEALSYLQACKARLAALPKGHKQTTQVLAYAKSCALSHSARTRNAAAEESLSVAVVCLVNRIKTLFSPESLASRSIGHIVSLLQKAKHHDKLPCQTVMADFMKIEDSAHVEAARRLSLQHASLSIQSVVLARQYLKFLERVLHSPDCAVVS